MKNFANSKILITGASSGIGLRFAQKFAEHHAELFLVARRREILEKVKAELLQVGAKAVHVVALDLSKKENFSELKNIFENHKIEVLVNNAGHGSFGEYADLNYEYEEHMIDVNVRAFHFLAHCAAQSMKTARRGLMINISSLAGFQPLSYMATYAATKAFDLFLSLALERELKPYGVQVLTVCPGPVDTEFGGVARVPGTATGTSRNSPEEVVQECFEAIQAGKGIIIPCRRARLYGFLLDILPLRWRVYIVERLLRKPLELSKGK
jgi:short-subunit dehydrogenase